MKPRFDWRHQYDEHRDVKEGKLAALECLDESLTQQHFTDDANLNIIAKRFGINAIPTAPLDPAMFRDTTNDPSLVNILDAQREAQDYFAALPAKLRKRFHNTPRELFEFVTDPDNWEEAVRLGLLIDPATATADQGKTIADAKTPRPPANTAPGANSTPGSNAGDATPPLPQKTP